MKSKSICIQSYTLAHASGAASLCVHDPWYTHAPTYRNCAHVPTTCAAPPHPMGRSWKPCWCVDIPRLLVLELCVCVWTCACVRLCICAHVCACMCRGVYSQNLILYVGQNCVFSVCLKSHVMLQQGMLQYSSCSSRTPSFRNIFLHPAPSRPPKLNVFCLLRIAPHCI